MNDIEQLKAENKVLKQALDKEPLAQKALVTAYSSYKKQVIELYKVLDSYKQTLQEIKEIAEKELSYDMVGNEHRHYRNYDIIRHLITKAEEE
jgi:hypothetical protein